MSLLVFCPPRSNFLRIFLLVVLPYAGYCLFYIFCGYWPNVMLYCVHKLFPCLMRDITFFHFIVYFPFYHMKHIFNCMGKGPLSVVELSPLTRLRSCHGRSCLCRCSINLLEELAKHLIYTFWFSQRFVDKNIFFPCPSNTSKSRCLSLNRTLKTIL